MIEISLMLVITLEPLLLRMLYELLRDLISLFDHQKYYDSGTYKNLYQGHMRRKQEKRITNCC